MSETTAMVSTFMFRRWIEKMNSLYPNMSLKDYHIIMNEDSSFDTLKRNICWGDSFMIDQANPTIHRGTGGNYRFIDYPDIKIPDYGEIVSINGVEHEICEFGFLTFDAFPTVNNDLCDDE